MPTYNVWYRDNPEPIEFVTAGRCSDAQILAQVLAHEHIAPAADAAAVQDLIAANALGPVRYTEDESEMQHIA